MSEFAPPRRGEDTDLLCVEISALGGASACTLPKAQCGGKEPALRPDRTQEEFLRSLLTKTEVYRPRQASFSFMGNEDFLAMRKAVVNWFTNVSVSYDFSNETVVAALNHFDRYVAVTLEPVTNHLLLQLAAYVALLVASKMSEVSPLRMKSLANLTGRMFTPTQVQKCELDMISKLNFRLAPPSPDETLHCLVTLAHGSWATGASTAQVLCKSTGYLKKARVRTCWFRNAPYTLAIAALATAYNSLGLGKLKRRLLSECDARARLVTGRGVDFRGLTVCAAAMARDERAAAVAAVAARVGRASSNSPICYRLANHGWGSPTGVAQGVELLGDEPLPTIGGLPVVQDLSPAVVGPKILSACKVPEEGQTAQVRIRSVVHAPHVDTQEPCSKRSNKRSLQQSSGSCFVHTARRRRIVVVSRTNGANSCISTNGEGRCPGDENLSARGQEGISARGHVSCSIQV